MNPQQSSQTPLDYLNQIAPDTTHKKGPRSKLMLFAFAGVAAIAVVIIIAIVINTISASQRDPWAQFIVKLNATEEVVNSSNSKLKSTQLRTVNSSLRLYITNTRRDITPFLATHGVDVKKLPPAIVKAEEKTGITERLETGRLNAKYDSTYAREMGYQTSSLLTLLQKLYAQNNGPKTKEALKTAYDNLLPSNEALAAFEAINE